MEAFRFLTDVRSLRTTDYSEPGLLTGVWTKSATSLAYPFCKIKVKNRSCLVEAIHILTTIVF